MWCISVFSSTSIDLSKAYCCDGQPILGVRRGPEGGHYRIVIGLSGYFDLIDTGHQAGGPHYWTLDIQGQTFWYDGDGQVELTVLAGGQLQVQGGGNDFTVALSAVPPLTPLVLQEFESMLTSLLLPYQNPPTGTPKSKAEIQTLANRWFPGNPNGFAMAMVLYDWTSADFLRMVLMHQLQYTGDAELAIDLGSMAKAIWRSRYPGYTAKDANFMNQFMMRPAESEAAVLQQLQGVWQKLYPLVNSVMTVQIHGLLNLPRLRVADYPQLYRGGMAASGFTTDNFAPSMFEFGGNTGASHMPLVYPLDLALEGMLSVGSVITTKAPWSFSNDLAGAKVWQEGLLFTCNPPEGATYWPSGADITSFSLDPSTFEVNVPPVTRYRIESYEWIEIDNKPVCHFTVTMLGYAVEAF